MSFASMIAVAAAALAANSVHAQTAATAPTDGAPMTAVLSFVGPNKQALGGGMMVETGERVTLTAQFSNLAPGEHGFHIHETGRCDGPDFASAGGHFAPRGAEHGFNNPDGPHAGDMRNINVDRSGVAIVRAVLEDVTLTGDVAPLLDADGAAVIVHADPDSYRQDAGAGARIACAVIQPD